MGYQIMFDKTIETLDSSVCEMPECGHENAYLSFFYDHHVDHPEIDVYVFWVCVVCGCLGNEVLLNTLNKKELSYD